MVEYQLKEWRYSIKEEIQKYKLKPNKKGRKMEKKKSTQEKEDLQKKHWYSSRYDKLENFNFFNPFKISTF